MSLVVVQGPHLRPGGNSELPEVKHAFEEGTPTAAYYADTQRGFISFRSARPSKTGTTSSCIGIAVPPAAS